MMMKATEAGTIFWVVLHKTHMVLTLPFFPVTASPVTLVFPLSPEMEIDSQHSLNEEKGKKSIIVILVGAPGSGKTTFCNDVMSTSRRSWVRICQDTIANGKAGTKSQCLKSAVDALKDGKNVFIDRCNLEREQRLEFVKLGGEQADVHAVVLDLPARLCISRSVKRTGHEGNLQGGKAAAVVNRMLQKKEPPKLSEGFSRITFCQNESDVKAAVNTYCLLGPCDGLPSGSFGHKNTDAKVQLGIMKFLKKVEAPDNVKSDGNKVISDESCSKDSVSKQGSREIDPFMEPEKVTEDKKVTEGRDFLQRSFTGDVSCNWVHTLAFPSISTSDFQFNHEKASDIITECAADFLNKAESIRLVLVDLSHGSNILSLVRAKASRKNIDSNRFLTFVGDITRLSTEGNLHCNVIANASNWRLKPGGGGVNAAIFNAAGKELEIATKEWAETLSPGSSVAIPLPSTSPLYQREGVTHIIHVLGPNMNPQRPNCLRDDYVKGCEVLRDAYTSLFENFVSISQTQIPEKESSMDSRPQISKHDNCFGGSPSDQLPHSDQKIKREDCYVSEKNKKCKGLQFELATKGEFCIQQDHSGSNSTMEKPNANIKNLSGMTDTLDGKVQKNEKRAEGSKQTWGSWAQALHRIAMHPEKHKDEVIEISDDFVVLNDLYPKAKRHILVLSRLHGLDRLANVRREHLPLLKKMHSVGLKWADKFLNDDATLIFRLGYHSVPSMRQLHLHVISQDFDSIHLKKKQHWNSFNSAFSRDSADAIEEIEKYGVATINDDENLLSMELRCNRCRSAHPNIPRLKSHITNCKAPFPAPLLQNGRLVLAPSKAVSDT